MKDYTKYHTVLAVVGSLILILCIVLAVFFWLKFKKIPRVSKFKWAFDKKIYFSFGLLLTLFSLFFALVVMANVSTALKPIPGFTSLTANTAITTNGDIGKALNNWVQSADTAMPPILKQKAQERINWQRPKAIICGILLVVFVMISIRLWRYLIKSRTLSETKWSIKEIVLFVGGIASIAITLLLVIMAVANMQGAIAPLTISLLGAGG